jgi:hypothetical protein
MTSIPPSIPADAPLLVRATELLSAIEDLPEDAAGVVRYGAHGLVLIEGGAVCWAVARGMKQRLTELLRHQRNPPLPRPFMEDLFDECRRTGAHLGEALLKSGEVSETGLRTAIFRHTAEAIAHIARSGERKGLFAPHARSGYDARFVFTPPELLASLGARQDRALAAAARLELDRVRVPDASGVGFLRGAGGSLPAIVAVDRDPTLRIPDWLEVASWTAGILDLCEVFDPGGNLASGSLRDGSSVVAWRSHETYFAMCCRTRAAAALVLARLEKRTMS